MNTINKLLVDTNKSLTRLRYEEDAKDVDVNNMLDILQHHIFLVHTSINKPEFTPDSQHFDKNKLALLNTIS